MIHYLKKKEEGGGRYLNVTEPRRTVGFIRFAQPSAGVKSSAVEHECT